MNHTFILDQGEFLGGAERFTLDFLNSLNSNDLRRLNLILVGAASKAYQEALEINESLQKEPFQFPSVRGNIFTKGLKALKIWAAASRLKKLMRRYPGSRVIISNTPRTHFVMLLGRIFFGISGKWIAIIHDFTTPPFLIRAIGKRADIIVANSLSTRHFLHEHLRKSDLSKIRIIENGISFAKLPRASGWELVEKVMILGRIDPRKGQMQALEAADLLLERHPTLQFEIVGSPVETDHATLIYDQELRKKAKDRDLKNVTFRGEVSNSFEAFREAQIVLVLPQENETFGRVVIEALAMGRMVIAFDRIGPREILEGYVLWLQKRGIKAFREDFLIEAGNSLSLAEKIGEYVDHPQKAQALVQNAPQFIAEHYNLQETTKRLLGLCR